MSQRKSPGANQGKRQGEGGSTNLLHSDYPASRYEVNGKCRLCRYFRDGMAGKRPSAVCIFTGERITSGDGCEFFIMAGGAG